MKKFFRHIYRFFIPTEHNNYRARLLHLDVLVFLLALTLIASTFMQVGASVLGIATDITIDKLYQLTNQQRIKNGLSPLTYSEQLAHASTVKGQNMCAKKYWAHYGPNGETPWSFILESGYRYETAGENLAQGYMFSENVVDAWMASPTHRENMLRGDYKDIGFTVMNCTLQGEPTTLVVQMFGKRLAQGDTQKQVVQVQAQELSPVPAPVSIKTGETKKTQIPMTPRSYTASGISIQKNSFNGSLLIVILLLAALLLDLIYAYKLNVLRVTSKNIAHLIFLTVVVISLFLLTKGAIL